MTEIGSQTTIKIELSKLVKDGTSTSLNLSHIYIAGFWSNGGGQISIKDIYLSNDGNSPVASIAPLYTSSDENKSVDVYNMQGMLIRSKIKRSDIQFTLNKGVYIINKKCTIIR